MIKHHGRDNVGDHEPTALQDHCSRFIGRYKKPAPISFTSEPVPVSAANTVLRRELANIITAEDGYRRGGLACLR